MKNERTMTPQEEERLEEVLKDPVFRIILYETAVNYKRRTNASN